jgi:hypothetical protein
MEKARHSPDVVMRDPGPQIVGCKKPSTHRLWSCITHYPARNLKFSPLPEELEKIPKMQSM